MATKESEQWQGASRSNGDEMYQVKSEPFGFTVYYNYESLGPLENKPEQLSEVVVISEENERLRLLESHLKSTKLSCAGDGITTQTLIHEAERFFKEDKNSKGVTNEKNKESNEIVCKFFMMGTCKFGDKCFNSHNLIPATECDGDKVELSQNILVPTDSNCNPNSKQKNNNQITVSHENPKKKAPMKTATDVINRIQWDEKLHPKDFVVGYLDRFLGVIENAYSSFNWEDVTSVDQSILAIPRHRIQYFKYQYEIVWDKNKRLDCVFGSTGSGQTILDIIEKTEHEEKTLEN